MRLQGYSQTKFAPFFLFDIEPGTAKKIIVRMRRVGGGGVDVKVVYVQLVSVYLYCG